MALTLTADERAELERIVRSLQIRSEGAPRAGGADARQWRLVRRDRGDGATAIAITSTDGDADFWMPAWRAGARATAANRPRC